MIQFVNYYLYFLKQYMRVILISFLIITSSVQFASAQMPGMEMNDTMNMDKMMPAILPMNPMSRGGSGTSWLPDNSPMHIIMFNTGKWQWMLHGFIFASFTDQNIFRKDTQRGASKFYAPNMIMLMGTNQLSDHFLFTVHTMFSLDPLTVNSGYPLLFQTGETFDGKPNIDVQHPHDLFDELAVSLGYQINNSNGIYLYAGYPGEPALGPCAFPHRPSAADMPDAPLGHHWQDATHVSFGVLTLGYQFEKFKIETSLFNGSEPDENRYDFDKLQLNSYCARISWNPVNYLSLQVSSGFLKHPEILDGTNQIRTTASAIYSRNQLDVSLVFGVNQFSNSTNAASVLLEASRRFKEVSIFGRYEFVQKNAEELGLTGPEIINVNAISAGAAHYFQFNSFIFGLGGLLTTNPFLNNTAQMYYGSEPVSGEVFLSIRP
jgi:hypothetical protein